MIKHNITLAFRNFQRNKMSFFINLIGLSTGLACSIFIFLWVQDELSVDKFHAKDNQLYDVLINAGFPKGTQTWRGTPGILAETVVNELPEVESATHYHDSFDAPSGMLFNGDKKLEVEGMYAGENYFDLFTYPLIEGSSTTVLSAKNNIVVSEAVAIKLFKTSADAMGKIVKWKNEFFDEDFKISGIYKNIPTNATRQFDAVIQYQKLIDLDRYANEWSGGYASTVLVLKEGTDINKFNQNLTQLYKSYRKIDKPRDLFVQKHSDNYLYGNYEDGVQIGGRITYVKLFSFIAFFILLIACINFMNLSTAQASTKMKEIGIKKTLGVERKTLITQFLSESILLSFIGLVAALSFVIVLLPLFNKISGKVIQLSSISEHSFSIIGITLFAGFLAGSYPALYLSGFQPINVLKEKWNLKLGDRWIRKGLVVFQFGLSIMFIVAVLIINQQLKYAQTKYLGYDRENVITFQRITNNGDPQVFLNELREIPGIASAGNMSASITNRFDNQSGFSWKGDEADKKILFESPRIGYNAIETLGMEIKSGRAFSKIRRDTFDKIVINESAAELMQLENPVGTIIKQGLRNVEIIGVVKDFQYGSIHKKIEPLIFRHRRGGRDIIARIETGKEKNVLPKIEQLHKKFHPENPFDFSFLDEEYQQLYLAENKVSTLSKYFAGLAILISCLGLFGLATFTTERRKKEISIRKVLGSSVFGIVQLLSKDFTKTVIISILFALPLSYLISQIWLQNFAYSIDLKIWFFLLPAVLVLLIAWCTVSLQTINAARVNPTENLKND